MDLKKQAAVEALNYIQDKTIVGLGAGSTIAYLVEQILHLIKSGKSLSFVTSSYTTAQLLLRNGLSADPVYNHAEINIYFDGCDQFDNELTALKSGGGIHTHEKICAGMAKEFILIGDQSKFVTTFDTKYPLVLEVLPEAEKSATAQLERCLPIKNIAYRKDERKDGLVITRNGNLLLDVFFNQWPRTIEVNDICKNIPGVVETSLFYRMATKAIVAGQNGIETIMPN